MSTEDLGKSKLKQALPIVGTVLGILALFNESSPFWVKTLAGCIGIVLVLAWLVSEAGWLGKAIKSRLFRSKLTKDQSVRLSVLLDDINNKISSSYTYSPFYVWNNCANKYSSLIKMNYSYHACVYSWMSDIREKFEDPSVDNIKFLSLLSKAVSEASKLAVFAEQEIQELLRNKEITEADKSLIVKEWDSAKTNFNQWIDKWQNLFKEINKTTKVNCVDIFRTLEMVV